MIVSTFGFAGSPGSPSFVRVELRIERGILFRISGFSAQAAKASFARIRSALMSCGHRWPGKAITVNIAPAEVSRTSTAYDLPIALAILASQGAIPTSGLKLSHRGLNHVRNVALTAALVDNSPRIDVIHIAEAGAGRLFDRPTWLR